MERMSLVEPDEKREPDWNSFETYKGPEEKERFPQWCYKIFNLFMILLAAALVFAISGALLVLLSSKNRAVALAETPETAWIPVVPLNELAKKTATEIGPVTADLGNNSCGMPDALDYIRKMEARGNLGRSGRR